MQGGSHNGRDWAFLAYGQRKEPTNHTDLGTRGQKKEGEQFIENKMRWACMRSWSEASTVVRDREAWREMISHRTLHMEEFKLE